MSLENEIGQRAFIDEQSKVVVNLVYTYNILKGRISEALKESGITMQQYNVLRIVKGSGAAGTTTSEIRERMLDRMSDASRMVDRLVSMKLIEKTRYRNDRRLQFIHLTPEGDALISKLMENKTIESISAGVSNENAQQLNELLDAFRSSL
jgi:DNA-binding MarR family transcriptional regulator